MVCIGDNVASPWSMPVSEYITDQQSVKKANGGILSDAFWPFAESPTFQMANGEFKTEDKFQPLKTLFPLKSQKWTWPQFKLNLILI